MPALPSNIHFECGSHPTCNRRQEHHLGDNALAVQESVGQHLRWQHVIIGLALSPIKSVSSTWTSSYIDLKACESSASMDKASFRRCVLLSSSASGLTVRVIRVRLPAFI